MSHVHPYKNLTDDQYEELFSNFLIDSWSYSKVTQFSRNEKAFEMVYIYRNPSKDSASSVAGKAYHQALDVYFTNLKEGKELDIVLLQNEAFTFIDEIPANTWKTQKTTPTIDACKEKATKIANSLIDNFFKEKDVYDFDEILGVETYFDEFLTINGVDMHLPCHARIDLIGRKGGKNIIVDHKSKHAFSDEKEIAFSVGKQAITYVHCAKSGMGIDIDEVWFVENKYSKNRDGSPQLSCFKMPIDDEVIRLYDAMLYEPLKRMLEAVSDPNYVYLMNESDNFVDKAELHAFWAQTMIAEVDDFNIPENKKEIMANRMKKIRDASLAGINPTIIKKFRQNATEFIQFNLNDKDMTREEKIEYILRTMSIIVKVSHTFDGFAYNTYLLETSSGTNLSSIHRYKLDIANALDVPSIRINKQLFMYEGKSYLAIEAPKKRDRDLIFDKKYLVDQKIPLGLDNFNNTIFWDLNNQSTPHLLMCGATGSGKSVCIRSIIEFLRSAKITDITILDPKYEFTSYKTKKIKVYNDIDEIEKVMEGLVEEMNKKVMSGKSSRQLVIFDEFGDAFSASKKGKELDVYEEQTVGYYRQTIKEREMGLPAQPKKKMVKVGTKKSLEENLKILAQKGRSTGLRLLAATQRASVKTITGDTKVNFPVQVCFRVPKELDSKVVLDEGGAEALTGRGDGLINSPEYIDLVRFQSFYIP